MVRPQRSFGAGRLALQSTQATMTQRINEGELHIWWANLRDFDSDVWAFQSLLSPGEQERAEKYRFYRNKNNHIISRGILRALLGSYVAQPPSNLNFTISKHGKPAIQLGSSAGMIHFNLSQSGNVVLYGITRECPIGVDVEYIRPIPHYERIALEYFSESEADSLLASPKELQAKRFFSLWTRKEALLKAAGGSGEAIRDVFQCEPQPEDSDHGPNVMQTPSDWIVRSFSPTLGYIAAVAFRNPGLSVSYRSVLSLFSSSLPRSQRIVHRNSGLD